jgi:hypothetical protein
LRNDGSAAGGAKGGGMIKIARKDLANVGMGKGAKKSYDGVPAKCAYWLFHSEATHVLSALFCFEKMMLELKAEKPAYDAIVESSRSVARQWLAYEKAGPGKTRPDIVREIREMARRRAARKAAV